MSKRVSDINEYKKKKKNNNIKRKRKKFLKKFSRVFLFVFIFGMIIGNISGQALISKLNYEVYYLKKDLREREIRLDELKEDVYTDASLKEIEKKAREELQMDYPKKEQIRYIQVDN